MVTRSINITFDEEHFKLLLADKGQDTWDIYLLRRVMTEKQIQEFKIAKGKGEHLER